MNTATKTHAVVTLKKQTGLITEQGHYALYSADDQICNVIQVQDNNTVYYLRGEDIACLDDLNEYCRAMEVAYWILL